MTERRGVLLRQSSTASVWAVWSACALLIWGSNASTSHAASAEPAAEVDFFLDLDRDGAMSYEEFVRSLDTKTMASLDRDRDGFLSEAEARERSTDSESSIRLRFSEIDTDGDQRLSARELEAAARKSPRVRVLYDAADVDRDHRVSPSEWRSSSPRVGLLRIEF